MEFSEARRNGVPFPPDPNPKPPKLKVPPGSWDTHFHAYGPPHLYPYPENRPFTPPACPIEHYLAVAKVIGFERGVIVQPRVHSDNPLVILDAIKKSDGRIRGMVVSEAIIGDPGDIKKLH